MEEQEKPQLDRLTEEGDEEAAKPDTTSPEGEVVPVEEDEQGYRPDGMPHTREPEESDGKDEDEPVAPYVPKEERPKEE